MMTAEEFRRALFDLATCWERKLVASLAEVTASLPAAVEVR